MTGIGPKPELGWAIIDEDEYSLTVEDPEGFYRAVLRFDGCVHYYKWSSVTIHPSGAIIKSDEDETYIHYCKLEDEIKRLQELLAIARKKFGDSEY